MEKVKALIIGTRALIFNPEHASRVFTSGFYGKPFGTKKPKPDEKIESPLELSLLEALYLCELGVLEPYIGGKPSSCGELRNYAESIIHNFRDLYIVYRDLRSRGYIVRSGLKFGSDFAIYERGPGLEHAPYLVTVMRLSDSIDPIQLVGAGRVSHSVRKRLILALVDPQSQQVRYIMFKWVKM